MIKSLCVCVVTISTVPKETTLSRESPQASEHTCLPVQVFNQHTCRVIVRMLGYIHTVGDPALAGEKRSQTTVCLNRLQGVESFILVLI